jgi:hypothetical protein
MVNSFAINSFQSIKHIAKIIDKKIKPIQSNKIFSRHACLGSDVIKILNLQKMEINIQKGRIDYLLDCFNNPILKAKTIEVIPHIKRKEIINLVSQLELNYNWNNFTNPKAFFFDSMAELADQKFSNKKNNSSFLAAYSDINHSTKFKKLYSTNGLLPQENIKEYYHIFFDFINKKYGNVPFFFLHFPSKLEKRDKLISRANEIFNSINGLTKIYSNLISLSVPEEIVDWDPNRSMEMYDFPYHYNKETYLKFAELIKNTNKL